MIRNVELIKEIDPIARIHKLNLLRKGRTKYMCCLKHHGCDDCSVESCSTEAT